MISGAAEVRRLGLWGNYSIPTDNPYIDDNELEPEIWALGFKNPWRCSFDSERPSYFMCGDSGEVDYSIRTSFSPFHDIQLRLIIYVSCIACQRMNMKRLT